MKTALVIAGLTACVAAGPAIAKRAPTVPAPAPNGVVIDPATDTRRVCVVDKVTGRLTEVRVCKERREFVADGFDPLAPQK